MIALKDILVVAPMLVLLVASLIPVMIKVFNSNREPAPFVTIAYSILGLVAAGFLTASMSGAKQTAFSDALVLDGMGVWGTYLILGSAAFAMMMAYDHVDTFKRLFSEKCFLMMGSVIGMLILLLSNDLIVTFLGIETMSLCIYILIAMSREEILSKEAAFKYFVLGSFASAIFLYGIAMIYGTVGSTQIPAITAKVGELLTNKNHLFYFGIGMLILGFAFKVSIFPFHFWTPDVYQGSPTPITAFMATAVKAATFIAMLRVFQSAGYQAEPKLMSALSWLAVMTMTVGNTAAILQKNFKRVLAYSSVAHSGYIMIGLIAAAFGDNYDSAAIIVLFYLFSYTVMTLGSFALIGILEKKVGVGLNVDDLKGLAKKHPVLAAALAVILFSLAGVPPTLGFFGKFSLFGVAIEQDLYWLAFWGVLNSVVSVYYYLRPVVVIYMTDSEETSDELVATGGLAKATLVFTAALTVIIGLVSSPLLEMVRAAVLSRH
ncbi:MAG: NADH-quinone oxidoreductase subunit N [Bdellovibrionaceae bacterium]|nr:NADH-quinone oxidoreductase subunit N [Pseudobdellovibrionaceae bacterium]